MSPPSLCSPASRRCTRKPSTCSPRSNCRQRPQSRFVGFLRDYGLIPLVDGRNFSLATDAEAAIAAALTYESLPGEVRDAWLDAIGAEASTLRVPVVAVYAPLLGVEADPGRLERMRAAVTADPASVGAVEAEPIAWMGVADGGVHACVVASSIYLDYVRVLTCRYTPRGGFLSAAYDPLRHLAHVLSMRDVEGVLVEPTPLPVVVDELAHAVLADRRQNRASPPALQSFVDLFVPEPKWTAVGPALAWGGQVG